MKKQILKLFIILTIVLLYVNYAEAKSKEGDLDNSGKVNIEDGFYIEARTGINF